jgi:hypothetical protein
LWLAGAYWLGRQGIGRWFVTLIAGVVACSHVGALVGGLIENAVSPPRGAVPFNIYGILIGGGLGFVCGILLAILAMRRPWLFWPLQYAAVGAVMFFPIGRW